MASGSPMIVPTRILGSSEECGSWNMSCRSRRLRRSSPPCSLDMSTPPSVTVPELGRSSATIILPIVVLPHPDSPTRPNVVPAGTEKETSDTAWTAATLRWRIAPEVIGYSFTRLRMSSSGAVPSPFATASTACSVTARRPSGVTSRPAATTTGSDCSGSGTPESVAPVSASAAAASGSTASATYPTLSPAAAWARLSASEASRPVLSASGPATLIVVRTSGPVTGCQQANLCSKVFPASGGSSARHLSVARWHLAANRQPCGGCARSGGRPGMACSAFLASWSS